MYFFFGALLLLTQTFFLAFQGFTFFFDFRYKFDKRNVAPSYDCDIAVTRDAFGAHAGHRLSSLVHRLFDNDWQDQNLRQFPAVGLDPRRDDDGDDRRF